jgi:hypothetical protein
MSARARKICSAEFEHLTLETPGPVPPALQVVAGSAAAGPKNAFRRDRQDA